MRRGRSCPKRCGSVDVELWGRSRVTTMAARGPTGRLVPERQCSASLGERSTGSVRVARVGDVVDRSGAPQRRERTVSSRERRRRVARPSSLTGPRVRFGREGTCGADRGSSSETSDQQIAREAGHGVLRGRVVRERVRACPRLRPGRIVRTRGLDKHPHRRVGSVLEGGKRKNRLRKRRRFETAGGGREGKTRGAGHGPPPGSSLPN
jgi:hypothetical protein